MNRFKQNFKKGFTFIELVIVIAIIGFTLPALFAIVFGVLQAQVKILRLSEVKRQGDFALSSMSNNIRNYAISTHSAITPGPVNQICITPGVSPTPVAYFRDKYNNSTYFGYSLSNGQIASASAVAGASGNLTSSKVTVSNLTVTCTRSGSNALPNIAIGFTISYAGTNAQSRAEDIATLQYQTSIKLRNQ